MSKRSSLASLYGRRSFFLFSLHSLRLRMFRQSKKWSKLRMNCSVALVSGSPKYAKQSATDLLRAYVQVFEVKCNVLVKENKLIWAARSTLIQE